MTRRQEIIEWLKKEPVSAQIIANYYKVELGEIIEDLEHIRYTVKQQHFKVTPARCKYCGFEFGERSKIRTPSKCPRCNSESIEAMVFQVV